MSLSQLLDHNFDSKSCFVCNEKLKKSSKQLPQSETREHVFPQWVLNQFNLLSESLTLHNPHTNQPSTVKYPQLTVPCCKDCNNNHLKKVEDQIKLHWDAGTLASIRNNDLVTWLAKIQFGLVCRSSLWSDYSTKVPLSLLGVEDVQSFNALRFLLQRSRFPLEIKAYNDGILWSIYLFELTSSRDFFTWHGDLASNLLAVALGNVGVICVFDSGQLHRHARFKDLEKIGKISPGEFAEVSAWLSLAARQTQWWPSLVPISTEKKNFILASDPWDDTPIFAPVLSHDLHFYHEQFARFLPKALLPLPPLPEGQAASILNERWPWPPCHFPEGRKYVLPTETNKQHES